MTRRTARFSLPATLGVVALIVLAACGSTTTPSTAPSVEPQASPGQPLGAFPGVAGFAYRLETGTVPGFVQGVRETLGEQVEVEIGQAAIATRDNEEVSVIAFGFPGTDDTRAIDFFARVLDDMEDGFGAGSQRGLGGDAYLMTANGRTTALAPWGRAADGHLIFLFAFGPTGTTEELVTGILDAGAA
ncbi:MAG TPA: hypothetical protein VF365_03440 [Candidatus Limnocylindria bacterium]